MKLNVTPRQNVDADTSRWYREIAQAVNERALIADVSQAVNERALIADVPSIGAPAGAVIFSASSTLPAGYLKANGAAISRTTYSALFAAIGTTYGMGDGSTTFKLPDLRGEFLRGFDDGRGVDSGRGIGTSQISTQILVDDDGGQVVGAIDWTNNNLPALGYETGNPSSVASLHYNNSTGIESFGSSFIRSIRPRNIALLACIKY